MKQVIQHLRRGSPELWDVPCPQVAPGHLLIRNRASVISAGTERMLVEFARGNLLSKSRQQPHRVRQAMDKIKTDGILSTLNAIGNRLDQPLALGYASAGEVVAVGEGVEEYRVGDRVASNGPHAEVVHVPKHLCAKIPDSLCEEHAAFAVLGAISLQGVRLIKPELGETIAVYGLGLLGLLAVQLLNAAGAKVIGIDLDARRLELAASLGAITIDAANAADVAKACLAATGSEIDGVLITASAEGDQIVRQAAQMSRQRGRLVLIGVVDLQLDRADFYEKELSFQVSCSYGPGRYDDAYEQQGIDYPQAFVRWTEQRNIAAVIDLMAAGSIDPSKLITQRIPHEQAEQAYELLTGDAEQLGIVLQYPQTSTQTSTQTDLRVVTHVRGRSSAAGEAVIGVIGAGQFARGTLLPALSKTGARLKSIASAGGLNAAALASKYALEHSTSDYQKILEDAEINAVVIATRHNLHAPLAIAAIESGKHVFVEKPLAIDRDGLASVRRAHEASPDLQLLVGFNRRFSPLAAQMRDLLSARAEPATVIATINAGQLPRDHWLHDPKIGGGRIIGEACHWIDLFCFLLGSTITSVHATAPETSPPLDQATITLTFADGSSGTLHYLSSGHRSFPKERVEVFSDGHILTLDNFRRLVGHGHPKFRRRQLFRQDKGHAAELAQFITCIAQGGPSLIPPEQLWNVTSAALSATESLATGESTPTSSNSDEA